MPQYDLVQIYNIKNLFLWILTNKLFGDLLIIQTMQMCVMERIKESTAMGDCHHKRHPLSLAGTLTWRL